MAVISKHLATLQGTAKVTFQGSSSASPDPTGSTNVSSGTDHGVGDYSYSLAAAFGDADFTQICQCQSSAIRHGLGNNSRQGTGTIAVVTGTTTHANADYEQCGAGFGALA